MKVALLMSIDVLRIYFKHTDKYFPIIIKYIAENNLFFEILKNAPEGFTPSTILPDCEMISFKKEEIPSLYNSLCDKSPTYLNIFKHYVFEKKSFYRNNVLHSFLQIKNLHYKKVEEITSNLSLQKLLLILNYLEFVNDNVSPERIFVWLYAKDEKFKKFIPKLDDFECETDFKKYVMYVSEVDYIKAKFNI